MPSENNLEEQVIAERYRIISVLGEGGMGKVCEAEDLRLNNRKTALKIIRLSSKDPSKNRQNLKTFQQESRLLSSLNHPGIPKIYDSFSDDGTAYLAMEFIDGQNLDKVIAASEGGIPEKKIIDWGIGIAGILRHLHHHKPPIIFRDLKPANIILTGDSGVKLVDFGIAHSLATDKKSTALMSKGTLGYASPEQFDSDRKTDERSDIYSLGACLHHLATGEDPRTRPPFSFRSIRKIRADLSESLDKIITKCLQPDATDRYQTVDQVLRDLKRLKSGKEIKEAGKRPDFSHLLTAAAVILLIPMIAFMVYNHNRKKQPPGPLTMRSEPANGSKVPGNFGKVTLHFNHPMNTKSVEEAILVLHQPPKDLKWKNNDTICEVPVKELPPGFEGAIIKISDSEAKDKEGRELLVKNNPMYSHMGNYVAVVLKIKDK